MQVAVTNPRLVQSAQHEDDENYFVSLYGSERVAEQKLTPTSQSVNGGTTVFSFQPPSTGTIMDKCVLLEVEVELTLGALGNAETTANVAGVVDARPVPKAWPINNAIQTLQVTINGRTITSAPSQLKSFIERMHTSKELRRRYNSFTPTFRDNDLDYDRMAAQREGFSPFTRKRVLGSGELSRYEWPVEAVTAYNAAGGTNKIKFTFTEPLFIDVFELSKVEGIHNINKIDITINWVSDLYAAMFSDGRAMDNAGAIAHGGADNTVDPSILGAATNYGMQNGATVALTFADKKQHLYVRYVTPSSTPKSLLTLPYIEYTRYNKILPAVAGGSASNTITFDAIRETMVPRYGILLIKRLESKSAAYVADTMFRINKVNIQVDNMQGILSTASPQHLWQMSTRNGLDVSWQEWDKQGQCIVVFEFGSDIGGLVPNVVGQFNMLVTVEFASQFRTAYTAEAELFLSKDGFLEITPNEMQVRLGIMRSDIDLAVQNDSVQATEENDDMVGESIQGSGFRSGYKKFRKFAHTAARGAATGVNVASKLAGLSMAGKALMGSGRLMN